jgi:flagellar motor switch protein FliN/FliY
MTVTASLPATMTGAIAEAAAVAAAAAAAVIPATTALSVVPATVEDMPPPDAVAHVVTQVGAETVEIALVAEDAIAEALAAGGQGPAGVLTATDVLRPALEAAAAAFGPGVLDDSRTAPAADVIGDDTAVFALVGEAGTAAWFTVRLCRPAVTTPSPEATSAQRAGLRLLYGVDMTLTAEIGRTRLPVRQVLDLLPGSLLELDRTAGAPADVMVNGRLIARGEVVVVDESYAIRITEIAQGPDLG